MNLGIKIGLIGYGNQGKAWAANLKDSGMKPTLFHRPGRGEAYQNYGFPLKEIGPEIQEMTHLALLIPDDAIPSFWKEFGKHFKSGQSLLLAHGFAYHFNTVEWPKDLSLLLLAPKAIGVAVREKYLSKEGIATVISIFQSARDTEWKELRILAQALGSKEAQIVEAQVSDEVEADLFSEQALQCGGLPALVSATYETLVRNGINPKVAYLECVHELQYMAKLFAEKGIYQTMKMASPTAQFGGSKGAKEIQTPSFKKTLEKLFEDVRNGRFLQELERESKNSYPETKESLRELKQSPIEEIGSIIRGSEKEGPP